MADPDNPRTIAAKLRDHADSIVDVGQQEMEADMRKAADMLDEPQTPLLPRVLQELRSAAEFCTDPATRTRLERLIGRAPSAAPLG
jgi:hypothetical protein